MTDPLTARPAPIVWHVAAVREIVEESERARTLVFDVPEWPGHRAGQHVDVRLTAPDGYQAQRSYSIASAPEQGTVSLTVERITDGEVSPYLVDVAEVGDELELRGPIGRPFTWSSRDGGPLLLVGGGSGIVPLMSMLRHRAARADPVETPAGLQPQPRAEPVRGRAAGDRAAGAPGGRLDVHPRGARRLDGLDPPGRRRDARRDRAAALHEPPGLRVRPDAVRGDGERPARRRRARPAADPRRALRPDRGVTGRA